MQITINIDSKHKYIKPLQININIECFFWLFCFSDFTHTCKLQWSFCVGTHLIWELQDNVHKYYLRHATVAREWMLSRKRNPEMNYPDVRKEATLRLIVTWSAINVLSESAKCHSGFSVTTTGTLSEQLRVLIHYHLQRSRGCNFVTYCQEKYYGELYHMWHTTNMGETLAVDTQVKRFSMRYVGN